MLADSVCLTCTLVSSNEDACLTCTLAKIAGVKEAGTTVQALDEEYPDTADLMVEGDLFSG